MRAHLPSIVIDEPKTDWFPRRRFFRSWILARRLYAGGHLIGLTVPDGTADVLSALQSANSALDAVLTVKTVLALLTEDQAHGLSGYRFFLRPAAADTAPAEDAEGPSLFLCTKDPAHELQSLLDGGFTLQPLRETSPVK